MITRADREWMYKRLEGKFLSATYTEKVDEFVDMACSSDQVFIAGLLKCPCAKCHNRHWMDPDTVRLHLYKHGFQSDYYQWNHHGEDPLYHVCTADASSSSQIVRTQGSSCARSGTRGGVGGGGGHGGTRSQHDEASSSSNSLQKQETSATSASHHPNPSTLPQLRSNISNPHLNISDLTGNPSKTDMVLHPEGLWFTHHSVTRAITQSFMNYFDGPYINWSKVPQEVRERWWNEFKNKFSWDVADAQVIREEYIRKCRTRLKDMIYKMRTNRTKGTWCDPSIKEQVKQACDEPEFQKRSAQCSMNRKTSTAGGTHCQGSISTELVRQRMTSTDGNKLTAAEVFKKTHIKAGSFVNEKSQKIMDEYEKLTALHLERDLEGDYLDSNEAYFRAAGGLNKRRKSTGLGSASATYYGMPLPKSQLATTSKHCVHELEEEVKTQKEALHQAQDAIAVLKARVEALQRDIQGCNPIIDLRSSPSGPYPSSPGGPTGGLNT